MIIKNERRSIEFCLHGFWNKQTNKKKKRKYFQESLRRVLTFVIDILTTLLFYIFCIFQTFIIIHYCYFSFVYFRHTLLYIIVIYRFIFLLLILLKIHSRNFQKVFFFLFFPFHFSFGDKRTYHSFVLQHYANNLDLDLRAKDVHDEKIAQRAEDADESDENAHSVMPCRGNKRKLVPVGVDKDAERVVLVCCHVVLIDL